MMEAGKGMTSVTGAPKYAAKMDAEEFGGLVLCQGLSKD